MIDSANDRRASEARPTEERATRSKLAVKPGKTGRRATERAKRTVISPPGFKLLNLFELVFSRKTRTLVLEPAVQDLQEDYLAALAAGPPWRAQVVLWRGYLAVVSAAAAQIPVSLFRVLASLWSAAGPGL